MIQTIIIDDENISLLALREKIKMHCKELNVVKLFTRPEEALDEIYELKPEVVFLDIEMPRINGFTFLQKCNPLDFEVIFTTAYSEYAIDALRISALDFLLKPISTDELIAATNRLQEKLKNRKNYQGLLEEQLHLFMQYQQPHAQIGKIALPVLTGLEFINAIDIIKVQGENMYSIFYLSDGKKITASLTLKQVDAMLHKFGFFRVHKSFIINLKYITRYIKGEGGTVILSDGSEVEVSRRNKTEFLKKFAN
ncbi:MAG: response regulator transcription factor [Bacteroidetes bacterium]|nr:response regulator transcription factor [Bacteroidota bacterium]